MAPANRLGNPFICGGPVPPSHFVGREREVQIVFDQITNHALGSIAICGDRRIGKTSLLQSGTGVAFDEHDRRHVSRLSRGHPLLAQLAGHSLFEAKAAGPVTAESYQAIEARVREEVKRAGLRAG